MTTFVTNKQIAEVAQEILTNFEIGDLHSRSSIKSIVPVAQEALAEANLPTRFSLACLVAKSALAIWQETVFKTKNKVREGV